MSGPLADVSEAPPPCVRELVHPLPPEEAFRRLAGLPHCLFLDSALRHERLGRYSFVTADPCGFLRVPADGQDGFAALARWMPPLHAVREASLPPFQGGVAGLFGYDLAFGLERLPRPRFDEFRLPALAVGLYDVVLAYDHLRDRAWLISQGWPESDAVARRERAAARLAFFLQRLTAEDASELATEPHLPPGTRHLPAAQQFPASQQLPEPATLLAVEQLAPQYPVEGPQRLTSNFSAEGYRRAVARVIEYIRAGDAFQVNLAQRLLYPALDDPVSLYLRLRARNPAPFAGYFDGGGFQIVSASPERFLRVRQGAVEARPIKGTRRRTSQPEADLFAADDLLASVKDRAENIMIVDLLRNDLSRACLPDSIRVSALCQIEVYQYVQHLVSVVEGRLRPGAAPLDLVRDAFPGGSITGAPKVRAMQIISELEPTARGAYCGSLGYVGLDGTLDLSILIRTITAARGWWQLPVGGGIVVQSDPRREWEETWHKAAGLIQALR